MEKLYFLHKLFWSQVFIFIDINFNTFDIMHDAIGWILLFQGLRILRNVMNVKRRIDSLVILFLVESLIIIFYSPMVPLDILNIISLASTVVMFYLYYELFQILFILSKERNLLHKTKFYFFLMITHFSLSIIYQNLNLIYIDGNFLGFSMIAIIIISLTFIFGLLIHTHELKKAFYKPIMNMLI